MKAQQHLKNHIQTTNAIRAILKAAGASTPQLDDHIQFLTKLATKQTKQL